MKSMACAAALALVVGFAPLGAVAQEATATGDTTPVFGSYDDDKDNQLAETEYGRVREDFGEVDADRSGGVNQDEYNTWATGTWGDAADEEQTSSLFDSWDDDQNAELSEDEWGDEEEFSEWDANDDGILGQDEGWFD